MVSQHGNNKAAAILRASLNRRTDGGALHTSRHGPGSGGSGSGSGSGRPPVAPTSSASHATPAFPDVHSNSDGDGDSVEVSNSIPPHAHAHAHGEESLALTDSIHGPDGITSSRPSSRPSSRGSSTSLVHSGHGDIESALPTVLRHAEQRRRPSSAASAAAAKKALGTVGRKLSAASLVRQVSAANMNLRDVDLHDTSSAHHAPTDYAGNPNLAPAGGSSPTSAAHFPVVASSSSPGKTNQSYDHAHGASYHHHHPGNEHNSCLIRFLHTRWIQAVAAVAVVCLVGAAVGASVGSRTVSTTSNASTTNGSGTPSIPLDGGKDDEWKKWEAEQNYDEGDKYEVPEAEVVVNEDMVPIGQTPQDQQGQQQQGQQEQAGTTEYVASTGAKPGTWITGGGGGGSGSTATTTTTEGTETTGTPIWLSATHFADPSLTTVGSTVSFSSDGYHLAISSAQSSTVQIYQLTLAEGRNWTPLGTPLPGKVASLSGDGQKVAVADATDSIVTTYRYDPATNAWTVYGTRIVDIWGARAVSLSDDGSTLAVAHYPDSICRICPSVASVFELMDFGAQGQWVQEYDVLGAYDFDFSIEVSGDGLTLVFSGRVYENALGSGRWQVKDAFPDFITSHSALSGNGLTAAVSLPDCHIFKNTDPTLAGCTNTEAHEVSVMEYRVSSTGGGWWNRKGVSIGPTSDGAAGTTALALSGDGNTVAIAAGGAGSGGEAALDGAVGGFAGGAGGTPIPTDAARGPPLRRRRLQDQEDQERFDDSNEDFGGYDAYDVEEAYVRVYRYDDATGDWHIVGEDIVLDASGATLALSADGHRLAVGSPYGGTDERGYVKVYDLVMQ